MASAYQLTNGSTVIRNSDGAFIPADPANIDWQRYQLWLSQGNTPDPYTAPVINATTVTNSQLKRWLAANNLLAAAQAAVTQVGGLTLELWYGCAVFDISDPLLTAVAETLGMSQDDLQRAFNEGSKL